MFLMFRSATRQRSNDGSLKTFFWSNLWTQIQTGKQQSGSESLLEKKNCQVFDERRGREPWNSHPGTYLFAVTLYLNFLIDQIQDSIVE
jgi:hypothetical protein